MLDVLFGVLILADFSARLIISRQPLRDFAQLSTWTDIVASFHFSRRSPGEAGGFLRIFELAAAARLPMVVRLRATALSSGAMRRSSLPSPTSRSSSS